MYTISKPIGQVVAMDSQSSSTSLDLALISQARLCATVIEASEASHLPMKATQPVLESLATGMRCLIDNRAQLLAAVHELTIIQKSSSLRETAFGCPTGPHTKFGKSSDELVWGKELESQFE
jgi:hypothetical protein